MEQISVENVKALMRSNVTIRYPALKSCFLKIYFFRNARTGCLAKFGVCFCMGSLKCNVNFINLKTFNKGYYFSVLISDIYNNTLPNCMYVFLFISVN